MKPKVFGICSKDSNAMKSDNPNSGFYEANTSRTIDTSNQQKSGRHGGNRGQRHEPFTSR